MTAVKKQRQHAQRAFTQLKPRELEVLELHQDKWINRMGIAARTGFPIAEVQKHLSALYKDGFLILNDAGQYEVTDRAYRVDAT